ncbi:hypothetical protein [Salipiger bermudensis]|uniref:hypothetical protein n=1 Tax=Salipiger bermudensis TaxID=344736 RepID=UPI001CD39476|nr:hypothetical protein [Salipiger bermudensis]MCA0963241.1 hypothetical protein [Salipiger bermudensis]
MSFETDLLGRPPVMRPFERGPREDRKPLARETRDGLTIAYVPRVGISSALGVTAPVTMPSAPWEVST